MVAVGKLFLEIIIGRVAMWLDSVLAIALVGAGRMRGEQQSVNVVAAKKFHSLHIVETVDSNMVITLEMETEPMKTTASGTEDEQLMITDILKLDV